MHPLLKSLNVPKSTHNLRRICSKSYKNFYELLEIPPSASQKEIKHAYYKLSMRHHPDKNHGCESSAKVFKEITSAYEVLGNNSKREAYNRRFEITKEDKNENAGSDSNKKNVNDWTSSRDRNDCKYDFDEWYRQHYSSRFKMERQAKENGKEREREFEQYEEEKIQAVIACIMMGGLILGFFLLGKIPLNKKIMPKRYR